MDFVERLEHCVELRVVILCNYLEGGEDFSKDQVVVKGIVDSGKRQEDGSRLEASIDCGNVMGLGDRTAAPHKLGSGQAQKIVDVLRELFVSPA